MDKVSIIIPCYNQGHFLQDAINSALSQSYTDIEVIVVNDGSKDNTSFVAGQYPVKLIEQKNKGLSGARNAGIQQSSGSWVVTLDADDKIHPQFVEKTIGQNDIVTTLLRTFGKVKNQTWRPKVVNPGYYDFLRFNDINCCSLFRKAVWTMVGGFDEQMLDGYEDWEFWIRATKAGFKVTRVDEYLFFYRKHSVSMYNHAYENHNKIIDYMSRKHPYNKFRKV